MYEDSKVKFNWKGFILKLIIVLLIVFLVLKLLPFGSKKEANGHTKVFNDNFNSIKEVGNSFFTKDTLPQGDEESIVTLRQLINSKKIKTLKGADKKVCNEDSSYIKSYKKNIGYELEVHLVCGDEEETSYIYLGCFDNCEIKPTTTATTTKKTTTTTKKATTNVNTTKKSTTKTTTTTTRVKKYAVIFNVNGGSRVSSQYVIEGKTAVNPGTPNRAGYSFEGWYLDGKKYDFNTKVTSNIILIAKWKYNDIVAINLPVSTKKSTYNEVVYSAASTNLNSNVVSTKMELNVPDAIKNKNNLTIKSISYIRNFITDNDVKNYLNNKNVFFTYDESLIDNTYNISNFGLIDNVELNRYGTDKNRAIYWNASIKNSCKNPVNDKCEYGILYRVTWEYDA